MPRITYRLMVYYSNKTWAMWAFIQEYRLILFGGETFFIRSPIKHMFEQNFHENGVLRFLCVHVYVLARSLCLFEILSIAQYVWRKKKDKFSAYKCFEVILIHQLVACINNIPPTLQITRKGYRKQRFFKTYKTQFKRHLICPNSIK